MRLTVLSVGYPLAKVSPATAGGAEQILTTLDEALVRQGKRSLVIAPAGSRCHGLLIPARIPAGVLDLSAKREAQAEFKRLINRTLARYEVDLVHMHGIDFAEYLPQNDVPVVVTLHLPLAWYPPGELSRHRGNVHFVSVSNSQARKCTECDIGSVITNGVDLEQFRPQFKESDYVLAMGRICPEKGLHLALEACAEARENLLLAGAVFEYPEHRAYYDCFIAPRLNRSARYIGPVGRERKVHLLGGAKCLLIPSQVQETSSLIAMEAMACGTPVVAWRNGALPEIVIDGVTGFIVSSVAEMADAIRSVQHLSRRRCREEAERRFNAWTMVARYCRLYESLARAERREAELQAA